MYKIYRVDTRLTLQVAFRATHLHVLQPKLYKHCLDTMTMFLILEWLDQLIDPRSSFAAGGETLMELPAAIISLS